MEPPKLYNSKTLKGVYSIVNCRKQTKNHDAENWKIGRPAYVLVEPAFITHLKPMATSSNTFPHQQHYSESLLQSLISPVILPVSSYLRSSVLYGLIKVIEFQ